MMTVLFSWQKVAKSLCASPTSIPIYTHTKIYQIRFRRGGGVKRYQKNRQIYFRIIILVGNKGIIVTTRPRHSISSFWQLTFSEGNDDPSHVVAVHEVHSVDSVDLVCHVSSDEWNALLALDDLSVDGVARAILHAVRLHATLRDESLCRETHDTHKHLRKPIKLISQ